MKSDDVDVAVADAKDATAGAVAAVAVDGADAAVNNGAGCLR